MLHPYFHRFTRCMIYGEVAANLPPGTTRSTVSSSSTGICVSVRKSHDATRAVPARVDANVCKVSYFHSEGLTLLPWPTDPGCDLRSGFHQQPGIIPTKFQIVYSAENLSGQAPTY